MKRFLKTLILVLMTVCLLAFAIGCGDNPEDDTKGLKVTKYNGDDYYTVYGYVGEEDVTKLDLAEEAEKLSEEKGVEVVIGRIKANTFSGNETIKELIVPTTVEVMDAGAFAGMRNLEKLTIPFVGKTANADSYYGESAKGEKSVDSERTFGYLFGTESFNFGTQIKQNYDANNSISTYLPLSLKEVTVKPEGEYKLPYYAFSGNNLLRKVNLNGNITVIGEYAFKDCSALTTITDGTNITLPTSVVDIKKGAFSGCINLKGADGTLNTGFSIANCANLTVIGESAFEKVGLREIVIPDSVTVIGARCFKQSAVCAVATNAKFIGDYAFYECAELTTVLIDLTQIESIGNYAFGKCEVLKYVGGSSATEYVVAVDATKVLANAFAETNMVIA